VQNKTSGVPQRGTAAIDSASVITDQIAHGRKKRPRDSETKQVENNVNDKDEKGGDDGKTMRVDEDNINADGNKRARVDRSNDGSASAAKHKLNLDEDWAILVNSRVVTCAWNEDSPRFSPPEYGHVVDGGPVITVELIRHRYPEHGIESYIITGTYTAHQHQ
jgi:hypothetical protein